MTGLASPTPDAQRAAKTAIQAMNETFTIGLFSVSGLDTIPSPGGGSFSIIEFARTLNGLKQETFDFHATDGLWQLGTYDKVHLYSHERYYARLREVKDQNNWNAVIAITPEELEDGVFNKHIEGEGIGIVTVNRFAEYLPAGSSLYRYLAYLVLCEALCLVKGQQFEHAQSRRCLFDMCHQKGDLKNCLEFPNIDHDCLARLRNVGFSNAQVEDIYQILTFVGTPSFPDLMSRGITEPGSGFLAGVFVTLGVAVLVTVCVLVAELTLAGVAAVLLLCLCIKAIRGRPRPPRKGQRIRRLRLRFSRR